ncbi:hypothetical protein I5729_13620 [Acinetobacter bereziniae]|nr:hypothetical protein [Acinetobacter bereziniae]MBJ9950128.1 hypothetical protein [Acinetobacter bereziniae]
MSFLGQFFVKKNACSACVFFISLMLT